MKEPHKNPTTQCVLSSNILLHLSRLDCSTATSMPVYISETLSKATEASPTRPLSFDPPLLNSANPWATTKEDLEALYNCPHTGAITTRTALANGFEHDDATHQYCFFEPKSHAIRGHSSEAHPPPPPPPQGTTPADSISSLNTLGYSPFSVHEYLKIIKDLLLSLQLEGRPTKPIIISVAGSAEEVLDHYRSMSHLQLNLNQTHDISARLLMEINLSCPNIAGKPPPAYSRDELLKYLIPLVDADPGGWGTIKVGVKTPPYTYQTQFDELISALLASSKGRCPISFITATNTLGSSLVLSGSLTPALNSSTGTGIGGLAGSALHPLALGNVATIRRMLDAHELLQQIEIIGVGGVSDAYGYNRMRIVGAAAVGVGTALGVEGVTVFERIREGVEGKVDGEIRPQNIHEGLSS